MVSSPMLQVTRGAEKQAKKVELAELRQRRGRARLALKTRVLREGRV